MKTTLQIILVVLVGWKSGYAQITTPAINAKFGVDGDLRANYFGGASISGNDDWFNNGTSGTGDFVIDTTGAAAMVAAYNADVAPWPVRMSSYYRTMSKPPFSIIGNRLWIDAIYVRDYHGVDQTVFTSGSNKNGMTPALWTGTPSNIPDKNDILDMMVHVRRAGPNTTDPLWMMGGISINNTQGNRYFDFEMYQTDIYYDRPSSKFYGYGPDAGHTSWQFDAAGNVTRPGDIIFSGEFQSTTLTNIEARIWVKRSDWETIVPTGFNYSGLFDGDGTGAEYGYASIAPNTTGAFYTGLGSINNTWSGPFNLVLLDNTLQFNAPAPASTINGKYTAYQFIEFSVNLTKLGLDPVTLLGGDICSSPFNRIVVKTRSSSSFTSELKDFVAPTDLFLAPRVLAETETPYICDDGSGVVEVSVTNPVSTSYYEWSTPDGHIISSPATGPSIYVDHSGSYIVKQYLQAGCSVYATDTVEVLTFNPCGVLSTNLIDFSGSYADQRAKLNWKVRSDGQVQYFEVQKSLDGKNFTTIGKVTPYSSLPETAAYSYEDDLSNITSNLNVHYRIKVVSVGNVVKYSTQINIPLVMPGNEQVFVWPNPVRDVLQMQVRSKSNTQIDIDIVGVSGQLIYSSRKAVVKGNNVITVDALGGQPRGIYFIRLQLDEDVYHKKVMVTR